MNNGAEIGNYSIKNIVFETLPQTSNSSFYIAYIPNALSFDFNIVKSKNNTFAVLNLTPLLVSESGVKPCAFSAEL